MSLHLSLCKFQCIGLIFLLHMKEITKLYDSSLAVKCVSFARPKLPLLTSAESSFWSLYIFTPFPFASTYSASSSAFLQLPSDPDHHFQDLKVWPAVAKCIIAIIVRLFHVMSQRKCNVSSKRVLRFYVLFVIIEPCARIMWNFFTHCFFEFLRTTVWPDGSKG